MKSVGWKAVLKRWEFEPARDAQNNAVAVKVVLPVKAVSAGKGNAHRYAVVTLGTPTFVAVAKL